MRTARQGLTIIEVVVAIVLLGIILTTVAGLTFVTARQAVLTSDRSQVQAAKLELVNRYTILPWDSLTAGYSYTDTVGSTNNLYERHVGVTRSGKIARVRITTTALQREGMADTVRFTRAQPVSQNPLCIGC